MNQSPLAPYAMAPTAKDKAQLKTTAAPVSTPALESDLNEVQDHFVIGQWEVEISDWRRHCIPNAWMACFCPCVSLAQISARITPGSFYSMLLLHLVLNANILGFLIAAVVFFVDCRNLPKTSSVASFVKPWVFLTVFLLFTAASAQQIAKLRTRVRERFQIPGSEKDDNKQTGRYIVFVIAQMATQVKSYTPGSCDFYEPDALPAYIR